jgi:formylmethanofuran dehydrogenase subunit E
MGSFYKPFNFWEVKNEKAKIYMPKLWEVFTVEIFESGEAEEKRIRPVPVKCPKCGSTNMKRY